MCEAWCLTVREELRLRVIRNKVLGSIYGPKKVEIRGDWRKLHNEELCDLYLLSNIMIDGAR
jgi:hypothetical protein